jgi:hypothetical protein
MWSVLCDESLLVCWLLIIESSDFQSLAVNLTFSADSPVTLCEDFMTTEDSIVEDAEGIVIVIDTADVALMTSGSIAVIIIDDDSKCF